MPWWTVLVFGWPAAILAMMLFFAAFVTTHRRLGFVGAALAAPFCFYVSGYPLFHWIALVALAANVLAAWLIARGRRPDIAFAALAPFVMIVAALAVLTMRNIRLLRG